MSLQDKLRQAAAAQAEAPAAVVSTGPVTTGGPELNDPSTEAPVTGNEGFEESTIAGALGTMQGKLAGLEFYEPSAGSYKANRLSKVVTKKGDVVLPNVFGYYEAPFDEEVKGLLEYYASIGYAELVE